MKCGDCRGDGVIGDWPIECPTCKGKGEVRPKYEGMFEDLTASLQAWELAAQLGVDISMDFQAA